MNGNEARSALDAVERADRAMAERMTWPLWRHTIFGVLMALVLVATALPAGALLPALGVFAILVALIVRDDKKRHGMFVSGYQKGRTVWVLAVQFALFAGALAATTAWIDDPLASPLFWMIAAILLVGSTALSLLWETIYRQDIRRGRA